MPIDVTRAVTAEPQRTELSIFYPGETLWIRMWTEEGQVRVPATAVERDDAPVLSDTVVAHA